MEFEKLYNDIITEHVAQIDEGKLSNIAAGALAAGAMMFGNPSDVDAAEPKTKIEQNVKQLSPEVDFVARVIYSETSSKATAEEVLLVASVINNRIGFKAAFGRVYDAYDVVKASGQFSCVGDRSNVNWEQYRPNLNRYTVNAVKIAEQLMNGTFNSVDDTITLYHDKSISEPPAKMYSKKYWKAELVRETKNFKFYRLIPRKK